MIETVLIKEDHVILVQIQKGITEEFLIPVDPFQEHLHLLVFAAQDIPQEGIGLPEDEVPLQENIEKKGIVLLR